MDSGESEHFVDACLTPGLQGCTSETVQFSNFRTRSVLRGSMYSTALRRELFTACTVNDVSGHKRMVSFPAVAVPGLGLNLFSVVAASSNRRGGVVITFDSVHQRIEIDEERERCFTNDAAAGQKRRTTIILAGRGRSLRC